MKRLFLFLSVILLLLIIYLIILNTDSSLALNYANSSFIQIKSAALKNDSFYYTQINCALFIFLILFAGIFTGAGTVYMFLDAQKNKVKAYQRELEKTSVSGSKNASKVEVLEAKIKTLEKAFDSVIDERTKLEIKIKNLNAELDNLNKDK